MDADRVMLPRQAKDPKNSINLNYPYYDDLPILKSHLHPRFAIFDAGRKLHRLGGVGGQSLVVRVRRGSTKITPD